jgi:hypothetical protein
MQEAASFFCMVRQRFMGTASRLLNWNSVISTRKTGRGIQRKLHLLHHEIQQSPWQADFLPHQKGLPGRLGLRVLPFFERLAGRQRFLSLALMRPQAGILFKARHAE